MVQNSLGCVHAHEHRPQEAAMGQAKPRSFSETNIHCSNYSRTCSGNSGNILLMISSKILQFKWISERTWEQSKLFFIWGIRNKIVTGI